MADLNKINEVFESLQDIDFADLSMDDVGRWPLVIRVLATIAVFALVLGLGYQLLLSQKRTTLESEVAKTEELKEKYKIASRRAANIDDYKAQMETIQHEFSLLVSQLPNDTEVPGLLDDISDEGVGNGLDFSSIGLAQEVETDIYVELPINIKVRGNYHNIAAFISGIASLPRIVTLHNFMITPEASRKGESPVLNMTLLAKTYRYNAEAQNKSADKAAAAQKKK